MKIALLLLAVLSRIAQASDDGRVLPPEETTSDARKTALVTLDSHHPWAHHRDLAVWRERHRPHRGIRHLPALGPLTLHLQGKLIGSES